MDRSHRKVVFLDRDGVINEFPGHGKYVTKVKELRMIPRALEALRVLHEKDYEVFVISNQAGIGKGVFSLDKLNRISRKLQQEVKNAGGFIRRIYYCIHRPDAGCTCRKPGIASLRKAFISINKPLRSAKDSFFIGDTKVDIETGHNFGCKTIFVLSGRENRRYMRTWVIKPDYIAKDLMEATKIIIRNGRVPQLHFRKIGPKIQLIKNPT